MSENMPKTAADSMKSALTLWQERYARDLSEYQPELDRMDRREELYRGQKDIKRRDGTIDKGGASHVRNITMEIIETQVDSNIPQPKVTAIHPEDEELARIIEDMCRNELDRLPIEVVNDQSERTCPIQGGDYFLPDWDLTLGSHENVGDIRLTELHPKKVIPQDGVYQLQDMDWFFVRDSRTRGYVKRRYGVEVENEAEETPEIRGVEAGATADELVTVITAYYRNRNGGIGRFVWCGNTPLEDLEDCQARRLKRCKKCGEVGDGVKCRVCGGTAFDEELQEYETLDEDITRTDGTVIPALSPVLDEFGDPVMEDDGERTMVQSMDATGGLLLQEPGGFGGLGVVNIPQRPVLEPTKIPYYKPDRFPLILRKNVSLYGSLLGSSDVDAIEDQQNAANKLSTKINKKVLGGGSFTTMPVDMEFEYDDQDGKVLKLSSPQQLAMIQTYNTQVDTTPDMNWRAAVYEEARQTIGITDSMQGRKDPTATSAVAKQFSAQQAAGRLESKRTMKQAFYAELFEVIFKLKLAYADEPRPVVSYNDRGEMEYKVFDRWDFLKQDAAGQWYWNDRFLFSCDSSAPLAKDREKLWQENRMNLQEGAYGPPDDLESLVLFWEIMEREHYPMAGLAKKKLQEKLEEQRRMQEMQQQMQAGMAGPGGEMPPDAAGAGVIGAEAPAIPEGGMQL